MTESTDSTEPRPLDVLVAVLEETGAKEALPQALLIAELDSPPETRPELFRFLEGPLEQALTGSLHPSTAANVIATVRERLAGVDKSGTRMKSRRDLADPDDPNVVLTDSMAATVPPPGAEGGEAYDDLVSGAIHSRVTPAWGIRTMDPDAPPGSCVWVLISNDLMLQQTAMKGAPEAVDVVAASSVAALNGALKRSASGASAVVLDARDPSVEIDKAIAALTTEAHDLRIIVWRMSRDERKRLNEAIPVTRTWLPCEAEVTPAEILQLLGL